MSGRVKCAVTVRVQGPFLQGKSLFNMLKSQNFRLRRYLQGKNYVLARRRRENFENHASYARPNGEMVLRGSKKAAGGGARQVTCAPF